MLFKKRNLDPALNRALEAIENDFSENAEYFSKPKDELDQEIHEDFLNCLEEIKEIRKTTSSVSDLSDLNEDQIDFVYQCLALHEGDFIISHITQEERTRTEEEHKDLMRLLKLFY